MSKKLLAKSKTVDVSLPDNLIGGESLDNMSDQDLINSQVRLNTLQFLHSQ